MLKIVILNFVLSLSFRVLATQLKKPTILPANCNQSLRAGEGTTYTGVAIFEFREGKLSITEIRFDPWRPSHMQQVPGFQLQVNPDSDSLILNIGSDKTPPLRSQILKDRLLDQANRLDQTDRHFLGYHDNSDATHLLQNGAGSTSLTPMESRVGLSMTNSQYPLPSTVLNNPEGQMGGFRLQRLGDDRYFEFIPEDSSEFVIARVLDIQENYGELKVLSEWVTPSRNKTVVGLLTTAELRSIQRPSEPERFAEKAISLFESFISPEALYIKDGFKSEGLPTLFNEGKRPNRIVAFNNNVYTYFTNSSLKFFPEAKSGVEAYFKMVDQPPSTEMLENLDPNYIYNWIINENGELQISVHVEKSKESEHVPRPTLYLLSKGRGIFIGGYLKHEDDSWQAIIDPDGGFYGVLSTQDVVIDMSDDVLGLSTGAKAYFHSSDTKVPIIPYLDHLEDYVYWIQEAFFGSTGLIPEVGRYWKSQNLWHQSDLSHSRSMDRPTTEDEARAFTILEKFFARQDFAREDNTDRTNRANRTRNASRRGNASRTRNASNTENANNAKTNSHQNKSTSHQETGLRTPWVDPLDLILFFADDFNTKITDLPSALWALGIDMMDTNLDLKNEKTIKRFYQKILSQYHQDSLVKNRVGPEEIKIGHAVTTIITRAWGTYKSELKRGRFR